MYNTKTIKVIAVYDNGGKTLDRYTIVVNQRRRERIGYKWFYDCICSSENGLGVFMWGDCTRGKHLGAKIKLEDLSKELQEKIQNVLS
jgi:hypothetical protein